MSQTATKADMKAESKPDPQAAPVAAPVTTAKTAATPFESKDPIERAEIGSIVAERNQKHNTKPPSSPRKFECQTAGGEHGIVDAMDAREAWARFNDGRKKWTGIRQAGGKVKEVAA